MGGYGRETARGRAGMDMKSVGMGVISVPVQVSDVDRDSTDVGVYALCPESCMHFRNICLGKSGPFVHLNTKTRLLAVSLKNVTVSKLHHSSVCVYAVCDTFISLCGFMCVMYTGIWPNNWAIFKSF